MEHGLLITAKFLSAIVGILMGGFLVAVIAYGLLEELYGRREWKIRLHWLLQNQRNTERSAGTDENLLQLRVVKGKDYENWREPFEKELPAGDAGNSMLPKGAEIFELEEITNKGELPNTQLITVSNEISVNDLSILLVYSVLGKSTHPRGCYVWLDFPTLEISSPEKDKTLQSLGVQSGDLVIFYARSPSAPAMMSSVSDALKDRLLERRALDDFFATVLTKEESDETDRIWLPRHRDAWEFGKHTHPRPLCIGALLLYTEQDADLAVHVRQYYSELHKMSDCYLTLYTFEHCPKPTVNAQNALRGFWRASLPKEIFAVWSQLGLTKSKPYPSEQVYDIADSLGLSVRDLPCTVIFRDWKAVSREGLILPIRGSIAKFFRHLSADVRDSLELMRKGRPILEFLDQLDFVNFADEFRRTQSGKLTFRNSVTIIPRTQTTGYRMRRIFLSYSSSDEDFVENLAVDLRNGGVGVWLAKWEIGIGESIIDRISQEIQESDYLVIVLSRASVQSEWVKKELNAALIRELKERRVVILPILLEPCDIPVLLGEKRYADCSRNYRDGLNALMDVLLD